MIDYEAKHRELSSKLDQELKRRIPDHTAVVALKKQKLAIKDKMILDPS